MDDPTQRPLLITGAGGFLGGALARSVAPRWRTVGTHHQAEGPAHPQLYDAVRLDIRDRERVRRVMAEVTPAAVIHCAAVADFNLCAVDEEAAWDINVHGTENLALAAQDMGAKFIYVSTDLVFRGDRGDYTEQDEPDPICCYGKTKYAAEQIVSAVCSNYSIARAALIFGFGFNGRACFAERLIQNLQNGGVVKLFRDEYRSPIYLPTLCEGLLELAASDLQGVFHLSGLERISRLGFGLKLAEVFGLNRERIISTSSQEYSFIDPRPADCSMSNVKTVQVLRTPILALTESVRAMHKCYLEKLCNIGIKEMGEMGGKQGRRI